MVQTRMDFLNLLIEGHAYDSYLEIGIAQGDCFRYVNARTKVGVDPHPAGMAWQMATPGVKFCHIFQTTSDEFFRNNIRGTFDLIFIDGWHTRDQARTDLTNALRVLSPRGTIVLHDCNPMSEGEQTPWPTEPAWMGEVWKVIVEQRIGAKISKLDLDVSVLNTDCGLGVVRRGKADPFPKPPKLDELTYAGLSANRAAWLNLKEPAGAVERYVLRAPA